METLTIDFFMGDPELRLKGLSLKALKGSNIWQRIYRDPDDGKIYIDSWHRINGRTAQIEVDFLAGVLIELNSIVPFDKIRIKGHYSESEKLLAAINKATI
jgi:hypothetical protein